METARGNLPAPIVFYDGVCGLCDRLVRFILERDRARKFRFATLQGAVAASMLPARGGRPDDLDSVYVLRPDGRLLARSRAVLYVLRELGGGWRVLAVLARVAPRVVADAVYRLIARSRYRIFGRLDECRVPTPDERARFLDQLPPSAA